MVRPRLQLERLDGDISKEHYYLQNKSIVSKKVREMSILTGCDVLFLAFSPSGIPALHLGLHNDFMNVVRRFSDVPFNDREKRRHDNLQTLRANYHKEGYNVDVQVLFQAWKVRKLQELKEDLAQLRMEYFNLNQRRRLWDSIENVHDIEVIHEMEEKLQRSLQGIRKHKADIIEQEIEASGSWTIVGPSYQPLEDYIPEMLSGNDDALAYPNLLQHGNNTTVSEGGSNNY